jgi:hypothetical protein
MSQHESPDTLSGIEEPSHDELMFLERFNADPSRVDSVLGEEIEASEDVYAQHDIQLVRMNLDTLLAETPDLEEAAEENIDTSLFD